MYYIKQVIGVVACVLFAAPAFADNATGSVAALLKKHGADTKGLAAWEELKPSTGTAFRTDTAVYIFLDEWPVGGQLAIPRLNARIKKAHPLQDVQGELKFRPEVAEWLIFFPDRRLNSSPPVVVLQTIDRPHLPKMPEQITANSDGTLVLPAYQAVTHGEKLRFEPQPHKNTVGYWTNPKDWAQWFIDAPAGKYNVQILQGCGKGHGGSDVSIHVRPAGEEQKSVARTKFVVKETGHFQNFVRRDIGEIEISEKGIYSLEVRPDRLANGAVMDVREVRLLPK